MLKGEEDLFKKFKSSLKVNFVFDWIFNNFPNIFVNQTEIRFALFQSVLLVKLIRISPMNCLLISLGWSINFNQPTLSHFPWRKLSHHQHQPLDNFPDPRESRLGLKFWALHSAHSSISSALFLCYSGDLFWKDLCKIWQSNFL